MSKAKGWVLKIGAAVIAAAGALGVAIPEKYAQAWEAVKAFLAALCVLLVVAGAAGCSYLRDAEVAYYRAQVDMAKEHTQAVQNQKPLFRMTAKPGEDIVLKGVDLVEVYYNAWKGSPTAVRQWDNQYLKVGEGVLFGAIAGAVGIRQSDNMRDVAVKGIENAGGNISGSFSPSGQGGVASGSSGVTQSPQANPISNTTTTHAPEQ